MAPYHEQPGLEVGVQPNDKYMPGSLGGIQSYSTAAMANTSTNLHPATEGHALHLANEENSSENPFSNSAHIVPNLPLSMTPSAHERSAHSGYMTTAQTPHILPPSVNREIPSDLSRSNSASSVNRIQRPQQIDPGYGYTPSKYSALPGSYKTNDYRENGGKFICGLRLPTFLWILALATVILVAGIGGGVGGAMAVNNAKKDAAASASAAGLNQHSSPTSNVPIPTAAQTGASVTSIVTSVLTASAIATTTRSGPYTADPSPSTIARDCTSPKKFTIAGKYENTFNITCNKDFVPPSVGFVDIIALTVYSINDCARACASYNRNIGGGNKCIAAAFNANWASVSKDAGNCWLKNTTATIRDGSDTQAIILLDA